MSDLITAGKEFDIKKCYFPVEECSVRYVPTESFGKENPSNTPYRTDDFKAIIKPDTNELLNICSSKYKIVPNQVLIEELMEKLEKTDQKYYIEPSHSYATSKRMRVQFTFPELKLTDAESDIPLSLFIHNSYDYSEGIRLLWGAIRGICSNGLIFGTVKYKFYHRHTKGFEITNLKENFDKMLIEVPQIQQRIDLLQQESFVEEDKIVKTIEENFGEKMIKEMNVMFHLENNASKWFIINLITYYISHHVSIRQRDLYQRKVSRVFGI